MRTFIAIELDEAIRRKLSAEQERLRQCAGRVKWTRPEQMHLTLKFLGEIDDGQADWVRVVLGAASGACAPFEMTVAGLGSFPPRGAPRILWACVREPSGTLAALHGRLERELAVLGFEVERRPFQAHVTIGRVKDRRPSGLCEGIAEGAETCFGTQQVGDVKLVQSTLTPKGPVYTELFRCTLTRHEA